MNSLAVGVEMTKRWTPEREGHIDTGFWDRGGNIEPVGHRRWAGGAAAGDRRQQRHWDCRCGWGNGTRFRPLQADEGGAADNIDRDGAGDGGDDDQDTTAPLEKRV